MMFRDVATKIYPVVRGRRFLQRVGRASSENTACCFGARLAIEFCEPKHGEWNYWDGHAWLIMQTGCTRWEIAATLWLCGATANPFGAPSWGSHPADVIKRLWAVETPIRIEYAERRRLGYGGALYRRRMYAEHTGKTWAEAESDFDRAHA